MTELTNSQTTERRNRLWWLIALIVGVVITAFVTSLLISWLKPEDTYDSDYSESSRTSCFGNYTFPFGSTAPFPASDLKPIGYSAKTYATSVTVAKPAKLETKVLDRRAHGTFVVVYLQVAYVVSEFTLDVRVFTDDFQLVDRTGAINCVIRKPTRELSDADDGPSSGVLWNNSWPTDGSSFQIALVFDIDKASALGAYLRVPLLTMVNGVRQVANLELGLS